MDIEKFYDTNEKFRNYVDKYCQKTGKEVKSSFDDIIIKIVANDYYIRGILC